MAAHDARVDSQLCIVYMRKTESRTIHRASERMEIDQYSIERERTHRNFQSQKSVEGATHVSRERPPSTCPHATLHSSRVLRMEPEFCFAVRAHRRAGIRITRARSRGGGDARTHAAFSGGTTASSAGVRRGLRLGGTMTRSTNVAHGGGPMVVGEVGLKEA